MVECQTCKGTYEPVLADGLLYFHVCPPLSVPELEAAMAAKTLTLNPRAQASYDAAAKADATTPVAADAPTRVQQFLATLTVARPNTRNENVVAPADPKADATIVSEGAGVVELPVEAAAPPATIATA